MCFIIFSKHIKIHSTKIINFQPRQNLLNAASRVGEASTTVLHTIGEETEEDKETQVNDSTRAKKSFIYRKLNYCYDNFYQVFFGEKEKEYGDDFDVKVDGEDSDVDVKDIKYNDDGIYEDIDTRNWGQDVNVGLDVIQEESDSDYYRSLDYCNVIFKKDGQGTGQFNVGQCDDLDSILLNCEGYLEEKDKISKENLLKENMPKLYPKTIADKIYNFKKDFSNHDYVNINFNDNKNKNTDAKTKNQLLREEFFSQIDKNKTENHLNNIQKKIECHSIVNDITKTGPDVKVAGSLNMKLLNLDKYNRVLTTTETFVEKSEASFTKNELNKYKDDLETFIKKSEKYYTTENRERTTTVHQDNLNNTKTNKDNEPKTEIRIFYNPTFKSTGINKNKKGFCQFCCKKCPRTDEKCCSKCICLELELKEIWKDNWLNILCFIALLVMCFALLVQCFLPNGVCEHCNSTVSESGFDISSSSL